MSLTVVGITTKLADWLSSDCLLDTPEELVGRLATREAITVWEKRLSELSAVLVIDWSGLGICQAKLCA